MKKKTIVLLAIIMVLILSTCSGDEKDKIVGTWILDSVTVSDQTFNSDTLVTMKMQGTIVFTKDDEVDFNVLAEQFNGKWTLKDTDNVIILDESGVTITELKYEEGKLIMLSRDSKLVFIK